MYTTSTKPFDAKFTIPFSYKILYSEYCRPSSSCALDTMKFPHAIMMTMTMIVNRES